jgi:hypothetical protein
MYQIILAFYPSSVIEGMETNDKEKEKEKELQYTDYPTDPIVCCKQNSGNIEFLKGQVDTMSSNSTNINKLQSDMTALQQQVSDIGTQMSQLSQNMIGTQPTDMSVANTNDLNTTDNTDTTDTTL